MQRHFEKELEGLKTNLIKMASVAEKAISDSIESLLEQNEELANKVISGDERVNSLEIEIDNAIMDLLALQQPVAIDLRLILAAQKINNDLERIGDHAVNIAESTIPLIKTQPKEQLFEIPKMAELAKKMLRDALDSFIHLDVQIANKVLKLDDAIDQLNRDMIKQVVEMMKCDNKIIDRGLEVIRISRNLERVGDLATNIAEEVIFISKARLVKHHFDTI